MALVEQPVPIHPLRLARRQRGMPVADIAAWLSGRGAETAERTVHAWEEGASTPSGRRVYLLAVLFGLSEDTVENWFWPADTLTGTGTEG
jgi:DNA-binding transcriptional regulator YiaG